MWRSARGARRDSQSGDAVTGRRSPTGPERRSTTCARPGKALDEGRASANAIRPESIPSRTGCPMPSDDAPLTPTGFLERAAAVFPGKPAVIHAYVRVLSYAEFAGRARWLASALATRGIGVGDTVAVMAPNVPAMLEAHYGVPMVGAVLNALNYRLDARTIAFILQHGGRQAPDHGHRILRHRGRGARSAATTDSGRGHRRSPRRSGARRNAPGRDRLRGAPGRGRSGVLLAAARRDGRRWPSSTRWGRRGTRKASCTRTAAPT